MEDLPYYRLPEPPVKMSAATILVRLIDGLGFRYRWATEWLRLEDLDYRPCATSRSVGELLAHIQALLSLSESFITGKEFTEVKPASLEERREETLKAVIRIREALMELDDEYLANRKYRVPWHTEDMSLWYLINGPLCDVLTHVGQISSWRRINDNPVPGANVFFGTPPL